MKIGIFTKPIHIEKIVNFLNQKTDLDYIISTRRDDLHTYDFDVGISYCFPYIVDIEYPIRDKRKWFNYHPALLPEYPGINCLSDAIHDKIKHFGVTLHRMTAKVDGGDNIAIKTFDLASVPISVNELGCIAHYYLFQLFKETIGSLKDEL